MRRFKEYLIIILFSTIFAVYIFESYLTIKEFNITSPYKNNLNIKKKIYKKNTGKEFDIRTKLEVYEDYKKKSLSLAIPYLPHNLRSSKSVDFFPLSGPSFIKSIHCNENGYYSIIEADRYGFNNPDYEWNADKIQYLIIGDSFAFGDCVNRPDDIASVLRKLSGNSVLNLGYRGNGPLMEYATLKEYYPENKKVQNILWLYFEGNDNYELTIELKNEILKKYLIEPNYKQNLKDKQNIVDLKTQLTISELKKIDKKIKNEKINKDKKKKKI